MIKTQDLTPEIYYKESRDFQYFGRLYDIIFNYLKTNADLMRSFPINKSTDSKLLELLVRSLGFDNKHDYNYADLNAIAMSFASIIRNKGSREGIEQAIRCILRAEDIDTGFTFEPVASATGAPTNTYNIILGIGLGGAEMILLEDILDYIYPAGYLYQIINGEPAKGQSIDLAAENEIAAASHSSEQLGQLAVDLTTENVLDNKLNDTVFTGDMRFNTLAVNDEEQGGE